MSGGVWVVSYVLLWAAVIVLSLAVVVLLRQIGVLHARVRPMGVNAAGEGLEPGEAAPAVPAAPFSVSELTLVAFTAPTCQVCAALLPSLHALARDYRDVTVAVVDYDEPTAGLFRAYRVASTPFVVAVDRTGRVRGGGVANSMEQVEVLVAGALAGTEVGDAHG